MSPLVETLFAPSGSPLPLPRLLVVFAHPDDEVLALGGRMDRLAHSRLLCVTDGAPADGADMAAHGFPTRDAYRAARRAELDAALRLAGLNPGCAGTLQIRPVEAGADTAVADQASAFHLAEIARALRREIDRFQPDAVLTHPYEGGHPDHDSCAFAVQATLRLAGSSTPPIFEAPSYFTRGALTPGERGMVTGGFLPAPALQTPVTTYTLGAEERLRKAELLACFGSQRETLAHFKAEAELFRPAPGYDFPEPPHAGPLFYEGFPWGMSGARFRELVRLAQADLERR